MQISYFHIFPLFQCEKCQRFIHSGRMSCIEMKILKFRPQQSRKIFHCRLVDRSKFCGLKRFSRLAEIRCLSRRKKEKIVVGSFLPSSHNCSHNFSFFHPSPFSTFFPSQAAQQRRRDIYYANEVISCGCYHLFQLLELFSLPTKDRGGGKH